MVINDDQLGEKRGLDILAAVTKIMSIAFRVEEKGETETSLEDEEEEISIRMFIDSPRPTTNTFLGKGKQKINECESHYSQQNPNHASSSSWWPVESQYLQQNLNHASFSSSWWPIESQYLQQNPNHASSSSLSARREPFIREPVRRDSFKREASRRELVIREPLRREPIRREPARRELVIREPARREPVRERTPEWLVNVMRAENGVDAKLIYEKELTESDVKRQLGRLLIPFNSIKDKDHDFLNEEEKNIIDEKNNKIREKGVDVILVDPRGKKWKLNLRRWDMNTSSNYVLVSGWNNVTFQNRLEKDHEIRLWSFRSRERLYFALVPQANAPPPVSNIGLKFEKERDRKLFVDFPRKRLCFVRVSEAHAPTPVLDELVEASPKAEEERDTGRTFVNFPKQMRTTRVEVPVPALVVTGNLSERRLALLNGLAEIACAGDGCNDPSLAPNVTRDSGGNSSAK